MPMKLWNSPQRDVDLTRLHLRGQNLAIINGEARAQPADLASLLAEFRGSFGADVAVVYVSKDGWQTFDDVQPEAPQPPAKQQPEAAPARRAKAGG